MTLVSVRGPILRLSLRVAEAAEALGVSEDFFAAEIAPHVPCVRRGRLKLYSVRALEQWLDENAERLFNDRNGA